jgi:hypothetical protein
VDVVGGSNADGTGIQAFDCNGSAGQQWLLDADGSLHAVGKCLDIVGGRTAAGVPVQLWTCNGSAGQQWVYQRSASGAQFANPKSGKCLNAQSVFGTPNGTPFALWECNDGTSQRFTFAALAMALAPSTTGGVYSWDCLTGSSVPGPLQGCGADAKPSADPLSINVRQVAVSTGGATRGSINITSQLVTNPHDYNFNSVDIWAPPIASAAVLADGTVLTWGDSNAQSELGDGTTAAHATPRPVPDLAGTTQVALGHHFGVALKFDGTVWTWGSYPIPGDVKPRQVPALTGVVQVAARMEAAYALRNDGTVWEFAGREPVKVDGLEGIIQVAAGGNHALALRQDDTVWGWGDNKAGQSGDYDDEVRRLKVRPILGLPTPVTKIVAGLTQSMAIAGPNSTVYEWGDYDVFQGPHPDRRVDLETHPPNPAVLSRPGVPGSYVYYRNHTGVFDRDPPHITVRQVSLPAPAVDISAAFEAWGALLRDGSVWTWTPTWPGQADFRLGPYQQTGMTFIKGAPWNTQEVLNPSLTQLVLAGGAGWGNQDCHSSGNIGCTVVRPMAIGMPTAPAPDMRGMDVNAALAALPGTGFLPGDVSNTTDLPPCGRYLQVLQQYPNAGRRIPVLSHINLVISTNPFPCP